MEIGPFLRLLVVRMLRMDRCILQARDFIKSTPQMGPKFVEPVTDTMEMTYDESCAEVPTIFFVCWCGPDGVHRAPSKEEKITAPRRY